MALTFCRSSHVDSEDYQSIISRATRLDKETCEREGIDFSLRAVDESVPTLSCKQTEVEPTCLQKVDEPFSGQPEVEPSSGKSSDLPTHATAVNGVTSPSYSSTDGEMESFTSDDDEKYLPEPMKNEAIPLGMSDFQQ